MALFTWYRKYSVNNDELDNHHKKLFDIFNRLFETCTKAENVNCVGPIIVELIEYSIYHFTAEEKYLADIGYKGIDDHKRLHEYFSEKVTEMQKIQNKNDYDLTKEIIVFLGNWLLQHVIVEDKKYAV